MKNNYRKILILLILLAIVATFTISPTFAATKTVKLNRWDYSLCYDDGTASMGYYRDLKVGSNEFTVEIDVGIDFKKGNKIFKYPSMIIKSNKKFKSATMYKFNVKTLKVSKEKTVKSKRLSKDWRSKHEQYYVQYMPQLKSVNWVPYKIVINY